MISKEPGTQANTVRVTFRVPDAIWATSVYLVGDFNNWNRYAHPLERSLHNGWRLTLELERGRAYHYRYLLNGTQWCNDYDADRYEANPFGGQNSVVET